MSCHLEVILALLDGSKEAKTRMRDEYVERYPVKYRHFLSLSLLSSPQEKIPLIEVVWVRSNS